MSKKDRRGQSPSAYKLSRRSFVSSLASIAACSTVPTKDHETCGPTDGLQTLTDGSHLPVPTFEASPFELGVASGAPLHDRVILWTRLVIDPRAEDGMGGIDEREVPVAWEIASDEAFQSIVNQGVVATREDMAHAVHVDADGLAPHTEYFYRFKVGEWVSDIGRTVTAPCPDSEVDKLTFIITSCIRYEDGYFTALDQIPIDKPDIHFMLGDYIYEYGYSDDVRIQPDPALVDLAGYRKRYALYKSDPPLRRAHAACPCEAIFDDHEISNNYTGANASPELRTFMELGFKAFYEHMPLRLNPPETDQYKIYRTFQWGDLATFFLLDTRQYRTQQPCHSSDTNADDDCPDIDIPTQTVLGEEQEAWISNEFNQSTSIWNLIGQQIVFGNISAIGNYDQWDGYPLARERFIDALIQSKATNPIILSGDIHVGGIATINADINDFDSPVIAHELVTPSITSHSVELYENGNLIESIAMALQNVEYLKAKRRGYVLVELTRESANVKYQIVESVFEPTSISHTEAEFEIRSGEITRLDDTSYDGT